MTSAGANSNNSNSLINNPLSYTSGNSTVGNEWRTITHFSIAELRLVVSITQIQPFTFSRTMHCVMIMLMQLTTIDGLKYLTLVQ
jgi:hypothetical protein